MLVREAMSDYFASAHISSTVGDVMEKMLQEGLGVLLIVDDKSQLVGSIEESLLLDAVFDSKIREDSVALHMDGNFTTLCSDDTVNDVVEKFRVHQVSEFPVIEENKLIGVLTRRQLLRAMVKNSRKEKAAIFV